MKAIIVALLLLQFGPRAPLTPAETLLDPSILKAIHDATADPSTVVPTIVGSDPKAGTILLTGFPNGLAGDWAVKKLHNLIESKRLPQPVRSIRFVRVYDFRAGKVMSEPLLQHDAKAILFIDDGTNPTRKVIRSLWSSADISDEVVEIFTRQVDPATQVLPYEYFERLQTGSIPMTTIVGREEPEPDGAGYEATANIVAASAYFLATLPNAGSEALLSHLTVGAHARLAEDGRKAVAQMGNQQRASADVLIMFGQAIEREQRRMRSFERYMPGPIDPTLHTRILDMERGITSVWTSMGITSSPFVPAAERIRGRGGEDRRIVTRIGTGPLPTPEPPTAFLKFPNVDVVIYELGNFIDGKRSISDIRDAVSAEFGPVALPVVVDYLERLAKQNAITIK